MGVHKKENKGHVKEVSDKTLLKEATKVTKTKGEFETNAVSGCLFYPGTSHLAEEVTDASCLQV